MYLQLQPNPKDAYCHSSTFQHREKCDGGTMERDRNRVFLMVEFGLSPPISSLLSKAEALEKQSELPPSFALRSSRKTLHGSQYCCHVHIIHLSPFLFSAERLKATFPITTECAFSLYHFVVLERQGCTNSKLLTVLSPFCFPSSSALPLLGGLSNASLHICVWLFFLRISHI